MISNPTPGIYPEKTMTQTGTYPAFTAAVSTIARGSEGPSAEGLDKEDVERLYHGLLLSR